MATGWSAEGEERPTPGSTHDGGRPQEGPNRRRLLVGGALVGWVLITALAAGPAARADRWIGVPSLTTVVAVVVVAMTVFGLVLLILALIAGPRDQDVPIPPKRRLWPQLVLMALLLFALSQWDRGELEIEPEEAVPAAEPVEREEGAEGEAPVVISRTELGVVLLVLLASAAVAVWTRSRTGRLIPGDDPDDGAEPELVDSLTPIVAEAARRLRTGRDPRTAVMVAYADLEEALTEQGHPPGRADTPTEHLRRVLAEVPIDPRPLIDLARLHEVARFSHHAVTAADQQRAADALHRVLDQLATVTAR